MNTFILIDIYNLFFRAMYTITEKDNELRKGMLLHTMFYMIKKACDKFKPTHTIICADGKGTWRKDIYPQYKANRIERLQDKTPDEIQKEQELKDIFEKDFIPFLKESTNISFLDYPKAEADDLIARFIALHPNDNVIIVSTDNDFVQLVNQNVIIYNTMDDRIITESCIFTADDKHLPMKFTLKDGKISVSRTDMLWKEGDKLVPMDDWIEYALFTKCIRGDKSDNIFSAYPGIREKSTKKTVGILDAFADRKERGYNWQTFMNSTWEDPLGNKHIVKESYEFNKKIIDLREIPDDLRSNIDNHIMNSVKTQQIDLVGIRLMQYLTKWNLVKLLEIAPTFTGYFSRPYPKG